MEFSELEQLVLKWAKDRLIFEQSNPVNQYEKLIDEVCELKDSIDNVNVFKMRDDIGDILVVLIIMSFMIGLNIETCLEFAYNEIKDRKGKMVNGIFVKDQE